MSYIFQIYIDTNEEFSYNLNRLTIEHTNNDVYEFKAEDRTSLNKNISDMLDCLKETIKIKTDKIFLQDYINDFKASISSIRMYLSKVKTFSYALSFGSSAIKLKVVQQE